MKTNSGLLRMARLLQAGATAAAILPQTALAADNVPAGRPIVALNQDCTQMQAGMGPGDISREGVKRYYDRISKGGLTHLLINPNAHNAAYPSKVWDTVWHTDPRCKHVSEEFRQFDNSRLLAEAGIDWVGEMVKLAREQGVSPWISMRMNDIHDIGSGYNWSTSSFWHDHPECHRKPGKTEGSAFDSQLALNFECREVRDRALALAREMLEKWDVDGIECDWMRFPHHVPDEVEATGHGGASLTKYMRAHRKMVDEVGRKKGRKLLILARVAATPQIAYGLGSDVATWAKEGLIDWVAPGNFWRTTDFSVPFDKWKRLLREANPRVRLLGCLDFAGFAREADSPKGLTEAEFCGYLERMYAEGIFDFETFNLFQYSGDTISRFIQMDGMPDGEKWVRSRNRAYPVTWHDAVPFGMPDERVLPTTLEVARVFKVSVGKVGESSGAGVFLALDAPVTGGADAVQVTLNGAKPTKCRELPLERWTPRMDKATVSYCAVFPTSAAKDGENVIRISKAPGNARLYTVELMLHRPRKPKTP